jgi:hypothetical protein
MREPAKGFHFSVPAKSAAERLIRTAQRLTEIAEFCDRSGEIRDGDQSQVVMHLFGLAEIEFRQAGECLGRLRKKVEQMALEPVLDQCS